MYLSGYAIGAEALQDLAEPADGPSWTRVGEIAKKHRIAVLAGGPRRDAEGRIFNAVQLRGEDGSLIASYDKTHLFGDVDRQQFQAGQCLFDVVLHKDWSLGFAICYDIEFPEVARALAKKGAEVILVPTANMEPFDSVAMRLVPARSEENGVYIAYANFSGADQAFTYNGLSCVTGPDGEDLARAGRGEELIFADLSKDHVKKTQSTVTYLEGSASGPLPGFLRPWIDIRRSRRSARTFPLPMMTGFPIKRASARCRMSIWAAGLRSSGPAFPVWFAAMS